MDTTDYASYQSLFSQYGMNTTSMQEIISRWQEPHRFYHTEAHLQSLITGIEALFESHRITPQQKDVLLMTAFFHDAVYDPMAQDNEEQSAALFSRMAPSSSDSDLIKQFILDTKTHQPTSALSALFSDLDMAIVTKSDFVTLLTWEKGIAREYQFLDYSLYKQHRLIFLEQCAKQFEQNRANLQTLIAYVRVHRPSIGVYAGSFNPFHNGHLNILQKAEKVFDKVIVAKGTNPEKEDQTEVTKPSGILKFRQVENFKGLLTNYVTEKEKHAAITLVRGLRNGDDLAYEVNQLRFMEDMKPGLKVVFIRCDQQFEHISSSAIRNLEKISKGLGNKYLPDKQ
jgi:pantetheine-phosphate adenylyltransferase